ncbi:ABC transporter permease [Calidifontibacter sp. DB0510]|uniref:ABC transporter permease n=1 Tax=Metallococcus carri TaxID=1656884 RepID=A0A967B1F3_9MICO|nr:ABC transporter permease [Metallococcus carri]NHN56543.1 ABC transporter permease [Metallococcus carri]NOP38842.1 ABC transporter permease [Calidifontibacter sp. DB2511S]
MSDPVKTDQPEVTTETVEVAPGEVVAQRSVDVRMSTARRVGIGVAIVLIGLVTVLGLGLSAGSGSTSFDLNAGDVGIQLPKVNVPGTVTVIVLGILIVLVGVWQLVRGLQGAALRWAGIAVALLFIIAFLTWAGSAGKQSVQIASLLQQTLLLATPLILGAMAGVMCEKTGVINVAIEGQMLFGAFAGALFGTIAGTWVGLVAAAVIGGVMGALLAVFSIRFLVNQVILGVVLNAFAIGLTGYLYGAVMAKDPTGTNTPATFSPIKIPVLGDIPVIGPLLFDQNIMVYLMYLIVAVIDIMLIRSRWGLRTRAVGEHPKAADTVGINVLRLRYQNVIIGGCIAGIAGAALTIGSVGQFNKGITSGQGFIALAALIFGRWTPRGALGAALFFGFATALQTALSLFQSLPVRIDSDLLAMLPYLATLFAVAGLVGRVRAPAADGEPYVKG